MNANEIITNLTKGGRKFWAASTAIANMAAAECCLCKEWSTFQALTPIHRGFNFVTRIRPQK